MPSLSDGGAGVCVYVLGYRVYAPHTAVCTGVCVNKPTSGCLPHTLLVQTTLHSLPQTQKGPHTVPSLVKQIYLSL